MKFQKKVLTDMERCYSVTVMPEDKIDYAFFATEGKVGGCVAFDCGTFEQKKTVWEEPGGTMSMVPLGEEKGFLAVQKFYRLYDWEEAELVAARPSLCGQAAGRSERRDYTHPPSGGDPPEPRFLQKNSGRQGYRIHRRTRRHIPRDAPSERRFRLDH